MAPHTRKTPAVEVPETYNNAGEALQERMIHAIESMTKEMAQHRTEMTTQRNENSGRQAEVTPPSAQPETSSKAAGLSMTDKLAKFKKFAPTPFKEAKTPEEADEWLTELEGILETLKTEEEDKIPFTEFLLQGEAREWWKIEKANFKGATLTWKDFREIFLSCYFPTSVCEQKEQEFLYLKQGNLSIMQYDREFRKLAQFAPSLVVAEKDRMKRFLNGMKPIMQKDLSISDFSTHAELLNKALKLERGYNQLHAYQNQGDRKRACYQKKVAKSQASAKSMTIKRKISANGKR